ncbi:EAL domain-containing protein, partial [Acinetobacter baumannii]
MQRLREAGIGIALDDFGAGYTSLELVTRMPLSAMHFERSFLAGAMDDKLRARIVRAVVDVAQGIG